jgi:peptidoglycan hydrolase-like protein with peptidoglycan-binding domain
MQRKLTWALVGGIVILTSLAGFWAGRVAMFPPEDPLASTAEPVTYEVIEQTIGRSLRFTAVAEWEAHPLARALAPGVITSIGFAPGAPVEPGDVLFTVDLRPVVVAEGQVPAFRDLQLGDEGADVSQLQTLLAGLGFLGAEPDGQFGTATDAAVRQWQAALAVENDGTVRRGDVVFAPELPARVVATDALAIGAPLGDGEVVVDALAPAPTIVVPLTPEQRDLVPLAGGVVVTYPGGTWQGKIARAVEPTGEGGGILELVLEAATGGPLCGDACAEWIPPLGRTDFGVEIVVVPETTGPVVPVAAILTDAGGGQTVRLVDGRQVPVEIKVSTGGLAVVSGVDPGDTVILPFNAPGDG